MHPEALKLIVANCHKRQKEGDKPTTHPYSIEQLEDTIVDLNEQLLSALVTEQLTAEREKIENLHGILGKKRVEIRELKEALTAECQRREQAERIYTRCPACGNDTLTNNKGHLLCTWHVCPNPTAIENLSNQLLSALAAIEDFKKQITIVCALSGDVAHQCDFHEINASKWWKAVQTLQKMIVVDLSLLHEHDAEVRAKTVTDLVSSGANKYIEERIAEVRKPLVDALNLFRSVIKSGESWTPTCQKAYDDALSKVKQ